MDKEKKDFDPKSQKKGNKNRDRKPNRDNRDDSRCDYGKKDKDVKIPKFNDPAWYKINDQIGRDVSNIPFNVFPGTKEDLSGFTLKPTGVNVSRTHDTQATPGVLVLNYAIMPGFSSEASSAINIAARSMYSWVRHRNSGHTNYEASDLIIYVQAMAEIYADWFEAKRIYDIAMTYSYTNKNIPEVLLTALGVDPANIRANLAQFRGRLNELSAKISSMAIPTTFTMFKRQSFIAGSIFTDSDASTSQYYVYSKYCTRKFNAAHTGGGALEATAYSAAKINRTYVQICDDLDKVLTPVLSDDDMNIMSGDILKAFGSDNLYILPMIEDNEFMVPVYSEDVLGQIHNAFAVDLHNINANPSLTLLDITQTGNVVKCGLTVPYNVGHSCLVANLLRDNIYFNSHKAEPSPDDCIEWTRNTVGGRINPSTATSTDVICGSEVILNYSAYTVDYSNGRNIIHFDYENLFLIFDPNDADATFRGLNIISKFDWAPLLYTYYEDSGTYYFFGVHGDLKRYTLMSGETRNRLNDSAIMAELGALLIEKVKSQASMN